MSTYTKQTWTDEVPDSTPVKYVIIDDTAGSIAASATISLLTGVTAGTPLNAANLNNIENGIAALNGHNHSAEPGAQIPTAGIAADAITGAKIADDQINSEHYVDGSIDTAHLANSQITLAKMAANSVDSDQYVDGSIDAIHIANRTRTMFVPATSGYNETDVAAIYPVGESGIQLPASKDAAAYGFFHCPADFSSDMVVSALCLPKGSGDIGYRLTAKYGSVGEAVDQHTLAAAFTLFASVLNQRWLSASGSLSALVTADYVIVKFWRNGASGSDTLAANLEVHGFRMRYTADS